METPSTQRRGGPVLATLRHRWPEYLIEIFVIVLSISISFGLDQWKDTRHEDEVEQLYLKTLSDNLASDIDALHEIIPETRLVIRKAQSLLDQSRGAAPIAPARFDVDIRDIARRPSFFAHDAAFSDLRSSGNLRVIHDFKLKNDLFDYYGQYESIKAKEASERESLITLVAPYLLRKIAIGGSAGTPDRPDVPAIRNDREFGNTMWVRVHERSELLADYQKELSLAGKLRQRIARDLH
jgi:signal transduction histidine kinase